MTQEQSDTTHGGYTTGNTTTGDHIAEYTPELKIGDRIKMAATESLLALNRLVEGAKGSSGTQAVRTGAAAGTTSSGTEIHGRGEVGL